MSENTVPIDPINASHSQGFVYQPTGSVTQTFNNYHQPAPPPPPPHQIPDPPADFQGRADELDRLCRLVRSEGARIIGLYGLGGVGKTTLAEKLAKLLEGDYPEQVRVRLYGVLDPDRPNLPPTVPEQALKDVLYGYLGQSAQLPDDLDALQNLYRSTLAHRRALILLDNARDAAQVRPLLPPPDGCLAVVTSRAHILLPGIHDLPLEVLPEADAVSLLLEIEPRLAEGGEVTPAELARLCGWLPLALRVIATAMHGSSNAQVRRTALKMRQESQRLGLSGAEPALQVSYELLPEDLQVKWRRLGVFVGDFAADAAAWVWDEITLETPLEQDQPACEAASEALDRLAAFSLVDYDEKTERYRLHDLARLYALKRLGPEEEAAARLAHARCYLAVLAACDQLYLQGGENVARATARFERERREIVAGQAWSAVGSEDDTMRLELCSSYPNAGAYVIALRLHPREQIHWREDGMRAAQQLGDRAMEGGHLGSLGLAYADLGEPRRAIEYYEQWLAIVREIGDRRGEGAALGSLGTAFKDLGEPRRAIAYYEQRSAIAREIGDRRGDGAALGNLGIVYENLGEPRRAIEYYEQHVVIAREIGDRLGEGNALGNLGNAYSILDEPRRAIEYYEQALSIAREIGDRRGEGNALGNLGNAYMNLDESARATEYYEQQLQITQEICDRLGEATACWNLGLLYQQQGDLERALPLLQVKVNYYREIGHPEAEKRSAYVERIRRQMQEKPKKPTLWDRLRGKR